MAGRSTPAAMALGSALADGHDLRILREGAVLQIRTELARWPTIAEAAQALGVSRRALTEWRRLYPELDPARGTIDTGR